ncbi:hypothetical protein C9427_31930 [Mesorhizobium helmanticense]|uniref:Uncharacterized protein n=1 Tax=Mesorhizobium helmanticense TaxID=1776423 RepID=A0A2T4IL73_9HYPH|nr:hypothetical protein C9427_31930 [Mesorhizobium helmanticense]
MFGRDYYADVPDRQIFVGLGDLSIEEGQQSLAIHPERNALSVAVCMPWSIVSVGPHPDSALLP